MTSFKKYIKSQLQQKGTWSLTKGFIHLIDRAHFYSQDLLLDLQRKADNRLRSIFFNNLVVESGIFKGMKYPSLVSHGSALYPKLIGCYEEELHGVFEKVIGAGKFEQIIDIGCAEGYYTVGLALSVPQAQVMGYDIDSEALAAADKMARLNGVADRILFKEEANEDSLSQLDLTNKTFLLCDCEGYERSLFTDKLISLLHKATLLIEIHDFIYPDTSKVLAERFSATHTVKSIPTRQRTSVSKYPVLKQLNAFEREFATSEQRPCPMAWLYLTPK